MKRLFSGLGARFMAWINFQRAIMLAGGGLIVVIVALFVYAYLSARGDAEGSSHFFQILRDAFLVVLAFQSILITGALVVLILQIAGLAHLLQSEIRPLLTNLQETLNAAKGSAQFVGENLGTPLIKAGGFFAGASVFLRELGGLRRVIRRTEKEVTHE